MHIGVSQGSAPILTFAAVGNLMSPYALTIDKSSHAYGYHKESKAIFIPRFGNVKYGIRQ